MSTKTTFKRIALVAVAALTLGSFSAVSATAAPLANGVVLPTVAAVSAPATGTTSVAVTGIFMHNGLTNGYGATTISTTANIVAAPTTSTLAPNAPLATLYTGTAYTGTAGVTTTITNNNAWGDSGDYNTVARSVINTPPAAGTTATARITAYFNVSFTPDKVGTYVIAVKNQQDTTQIALWTVAVTAADVTAAAATTTSILNAGETTTATADATVSASMALSDTATATIAVTPLNAAGTAATATLTVAVSGPGTVAVGASLAAISALSTGTGRAVTGAAGSYFVGVFADGTAGKSTITVSSGTTVLSTETVTFYGAAAKITPTVVNSVLVIGANTGVITAVVTDANGVVVPGVTVYAVSATAAAVSNSYTSCGASSATGAVSCDLAGVAAGTSAITLTLNSASTGTSTVSAVAGTMRVSDGVPTKVVYAFDKESYAPGEAAKITATVSNAAGVMAAGTHTVLTTALSANFTLAGLPGTLTVASLLSTGVATYTTTIPAGLSGTITLTGVAATGVTATFGSATIVNVALDAAIAATDAASEAIDAANAATDAANAAAEAADAATAAAQDAADAIAALSVQVTEQIAELKALNDVQAKAIAALRKQLIALTNLIIKIQKKVKA